MIVSLVGAGPGDPKLLTRRGLELLQSADCLVYDALVAPQLLELAPENCEKIFVGKRAGHHSMTQDEINALLVEKAREGKNVCRLKGGDPFVFGRGGEEALFLRENGVGFEIVPGISSAIAAPAYAGIPVTHRDVAASFAVVTGHTASDDAPPENFPIADTLVFLMGVRALPQIVARLRERGEAPEKAVAVVRWGTRNEQETVVGTLETIEAEVEKAGLKAPALIVVGDVVNLRDRLRWFDNRPLWGQTIVVTRAREQASSLVEGLENLGARVVQCPTIQVEGLESYHVLNAALQKLDEFDWVIFTSVNGVEAFWRQFRLWHLDARGLASVEVAAIGPATTEALEKRGIFADLVPQSAISEKVAEELMQIGVSGKKILVVRALEGRDVLEEALRKGAAEVTVAPVYRTLPDSGNVGEVRELMKTGTLNWVTFTSSSTVKNFLEVVGEKGVLKSRAKFRVACIGPITAQTARENGLEPDVVAGAASVEALSQAILEAK